MEQEFYTCEQNDIRWTAVSKYSHIVESRVLRRIEHIPSLEKCKLVKRNLYRTTYVYKPIHPAAAGVYIKRYQIRDWGDKFLTKLRQSQAYREWKMMLLMGQKGFPVPQPVALGEREHKKTIENYLVTLEILNAVPVREAPDIQKEEVLLALASLADKLRRENIFYKDFQLGNILLKKRGAKSEIFLVDLHSARLLTALSKGQILYMLAKLIDSFAPAFNAVDQDRFLDLYAQADPSFKMGAAQNKEGVKALAARIRQTHLKSRTKRCLVRSTGFSVGYYEGLRLFHRKDFDRHSVLNAFKAYRESAGNSKDTLKSTKKTSLSIVETSAGKVCVKRYISINMLDRIKGGLGLSRARRAWVIGNGLVVRNIPTSTPLALLEGTNESFLITTALVGFPRMDYYILENFKETRSGSAFQRKKDFISSFTRALWSLHEKNTYHGDLKACNILVEELPENKWEFYFIDYDKVVFDHEVSIRRRIKNIAQLHTSIPWCITWADRMRFFKSYAGDAGYEHSKAAFLREVMRESNKRIPVHMEPLE
ncbi:MAG: lipopolysaccharide kinase InaA family protein [Candidatus Brocadiales bacterium]